MASILVGFIGEVYGWHYGFSLAGFGMLLGQITFVSGKNKLIQIKKKLKEIAGFINGSLSQIEFDRIKLILIASLILIIFWASFEQAGGLLNIYAYEKTDRYIDIFRI